MTEILTELKAIYCSTRVPMDRRIEAAAVVLTHEAPEALVKNATAFLEGVSKAVSLHPDYRIDAIKALAKRAVPKAAAPADGPVEGLGERLRAARLAAFPASAPVPTAPKGLAKGQRPGLADRLGAARRKAGLRPR
jgi:hypothetical protein